VSVERGATSPTPSQRQGWEALPPRPSMHRRSPDCISVECPPYNSFEPSVGADSLTLLSESTSPHPKRSSENRWAEEQTLSPSTKNICHIWLDGAREQLARRSQQFPTDGIELPHRPDPAPQSRASSAGDSEGHVEFVDALSWHNDVFDGADVGSEAWWDDGEVFVDAVEECGEDFRSNAPIDVDEDEARLHHNPRCSADVDGELIEWFDEEHMISEAPCGRCLCSSCASQLPTMQVRAVADFTSEDDNDLSFCEGDVILVLEQKESGWWHGKLVAPSTDLVFERTLMEERQGWFPCTYVEWVPTVCVSVQTSL
jgi:hypothetical protein